MALLTCDDCGAQVSDQAGACPSCGRPVADACASCGKGSPVTGTGLHGALEILTVIVWVIAGLVIGLLLYFYLSSRPWCPACRKRPQPVSVAALMLLLLTGLYADLWVVAYATGGPV